MDVTSRKLAEDAARAAGYLLGQWDKAANAYAWRTDESQQWWNPVEAYAYGDCMGDALRLAVKLRMRLDVLVESACITIHCARPKNETIWLHLHESTYNVELDAATRRAITRAAAELSPKE